MKKNKEMKNSIIKILQCILIAYSSIKVSRILEFTNTAFIYSMSFISFFFLQYFLINYNKKNSKNISENKIARYLVIAYQVVLAGVLVYANDVNLLYENGLASFIFVNIKNRILDFIGLNIILEIIFKAITNYFLNKDEQLVSSGKDKKRVILRFVAIWLVIMIAWVPYFLALYPAAMSPDSIDQLQQAVGVYSFTNHHPIITTSLLKLCISITNAIKTGVVLYVIIQMSIMALINTYFINTIAKTNCKKIFIYLCIAYFAFNPIHGMYACTIWKDVLYGGSVLLLATLLLNMHMSSYKNLDKIVTKILLVLSIIFVSTIRSNGFLIVLLMLPFMFFITNKNKKIITLFIIGIVCGYFIKSPLCKILNVAQPNSAESVGIPLKQICEVVKRESPLTNDEKAFIESIIPLEVIEENYTPLSADSIKFNANFNNKNLNENKGTFIKYWAKIGLKYPGIYVESYIKSTNCFWNPVSIDTWFFKGIIENELIKEDTKFEVLYNIFEIIHNRISMIPIVGLMYSYGLIIWFVVFVIGLNIIRKNYYIALISAIPFFNVLTLMIASPVARQLRYVYSMYTMLPLIFIACIYNIKRKEDLKCLK